MSNYALKKVRRIIINDASTKEMKVILQDLKNVQLSNGQDTVWAEGTDGKRLQGFDERKVSTITASNGTVSMGLLAMQVGADDIETVANGTGILVTEKFTLTAETLTSIVLAHKARGTVGNEIGYVYLLDSTGAKKTSYEQGASASATAFAYTENTKTIALPTTGLAVGDVVMVNYYPKFTTYEEIANKSNNFSAEGEVILDGWFTNICDGTDVPMQWVTAKAKISGANDLSFGNAAAVHNLSIDVVGRACEESSTLWTLRKYDTDDIIDT